MISGSNRRYYPRKTGKDNRNLYERHLEMMSEKNYNSLVGTRKWKAERTEGKNKKGRTLTAGNNLQFEVLLKSNHRK